MFILRKIVFIMTSPKKCPITYFCPETEFCLPTILSQKNIFSENDCEDCELLILTLKAK